MNVKERIAQLSLEEKLALLTGKDNWNTVAVERLGIPSITVSDGPHGLRKEYTNADGSKETYPSTCFPTSSAMAATWNRELVREVGQALGDECGAAEVDVLLGPGTNIKRTPLCGRNFEYFSEDPFLAGELAAAYIEGVQSRGVGTSLKHYAANNQEFDRNHISSEVDIRALREIYLKPFETAVKKSQPWTVMCAYNRLNGIYCSENRFLLNDILREEFGFEGVVVSDWWAVHDRANALKASLELEMPFSDQSIANLSKAYQTGEISDVEIDAALERLLNLVYKAVDSRNERIKKFDADRHHRLAKEAALEAVVLLKNEDRILPIIKEKVKKLAVIGHCAKAPFIQGGGSAQVNPKKIDNSLERIVELAGTDIEVEYAQAYYNAETFPVVDGLHYAMNVAENADMAVVFVGNTLRIETESYDRTAMTLSPHLEQVILNIAARNSNTVVVVQAGSAVDMSAWIGSVKAVVFAGFTGQAGGSAVAEILFGTANPSGKIAETFPLCLEDTPSCGTYPGNGIASWYAEGIMVGYRHYDTYGKEVLFPFGHGLSYTTFTYSDLRVPLDAARESETVTVKFKLKNSGCVYGKETVQLYVKDVACKVLRPFKELKAFAKTGLQPGEEKEIQFELDRDAFSYYNSSLNRWHVESGKFQILIGSSSRDIKLQGVVHLKSDSDFS